MEKKSRKAILFIVNLKKDSKKLSLQSGQEIKVRQCLTLVKMSEKSTLCTKEGTLNATETAVCNSFDNLLVLRTLIFLPFWTGNCLVLYYNV